MGSSKKVTVGYKYYLGMHMILCHGPVDTIRSIKVDGRTAWESGGFAGGQIQVSAESLFGGETKEGGVSGAVDIEMGYPDQGKNTYLLSQLGADLPNFRGVVGAVLRRCYLGLNPYLKRWAFRLQRIHVRQNGLEQWYDAKAEVKGADEVLVSVTSDGWEYVQLPEQANPGYDNLTPPSSGWAAGTSPFGSGGWTWPGQPARNTQWDQSSVLWLRRQITVPSGRTIVARVRAENGCVLFLNGAYFGAANRENVQLFSGEVFDFLLPPGTHTLHIKAFDEVPTLGDTYISLEVVSISFADMNPAHIIRECLTDPDWGMGYQESDVDDDSFKDAADVLYAERMGISLLWDRQMPIQDFVTQIMKHINASLYVDRATGLFVLKLIRADYVKEDLLHLTEDNITKVENASRPTIGELVNSITVNYWDAASGEDASLTVQDQALIQMQGAVINTTLQFPGFTNKTIAAQVGLRSLQSLSTPLLSATVYADRNAAGLNVGDVFRMSWPDLEVDDLVMRVAGLALGDGKNNSVKLTVMEDAFSFPDTATVVPVDPPWIDPSSPPRPALDRLAFESPYYEVVQAQGQPKTDADLLSNPDLGYVAFAAGSVTGGINAVVATDSGAGYEDAATLDFCPVATLATAVEQADDVPTTFMLSAGRNLDMVQVGWHAQVDDELFRVDALDLLTGELTVGRAVLDTVPKPHAAGAKVFFWGLYSAADPQEYVSGESVDVKIMPVAGQGQLPLDSAPVDTVVLSGRAARPYPPGDFKVNGSYFPSIVDPSVDIVLTWVSRNRLQQTSGELLDFFDGSVTPEAGVTYTVRVLDADNPATVVYEETGIAGLTHTIPGGSITTAERVRLQVLSVRDGLESWQAHELEFDTDIDVILWTPAQLSPVEWWDFSDATTVTSSGGFISAISSKGSGARSALQGTSANRPSVTTINGVTAALFDGGNDNLSLSSSLSTTTGMTVAQVFTRPAASVFSSPLGGATYSAPPYATQWFTDNIRYSALWAASGSYATHGSASSATGAFQHIVVKGASTTLLYQDGSVVGTPQTISSGQGSIAYLGRRGDNYHNGKIGEIVVVASDISTADREKLEGYLAHKWGLTANLPSGHPYKSSPPTV